MADAMVLNIAEDAMQVARAMQRLDLLAEATAEGADRDFRAVDAGCGAEDAEGPERHVAGMADEAAALEILRRAPGPAALTAMVEGEALNIAYTPTGAEPGCVAPPARSTR